MGHVCQRITFAIKENISLVGGDQILLFLILKSPPLKVYKQDCLWASIVGNLSL